MVYYRGMQVDICDCCDKEVSRRDVPKTCPACGPVERRFNMMLDELSARHREEIMKTKRDWMRKNGAKIPQAAPCEAESVPALSPTDSTSPTVAPSQGASH